MNLRDAPVLYRVITAIFLVGAVAVALAWWNAWRGMDATDPNGFWVELGRAGLQAFVVGGLGAILSVALHHTEAQRKETERERDETRDEMRRLNDYRLDVLRRVRTAYSKTKLVRRRLEIAGFRELSVCHLAGKNAAIYATAMDELIVLKLELEAIMDELRAGAGKEGSTQEILGHVKAMEGYLDKQLVDEYREWARMRRQRPCLRPRAFTVQGKDMACVPNVRAFVADAKVSFQDNFSTHYHAVLEMLVTDIRMPPRSATKPGSVPPS